MKQPLRDVVALYALDASRFDVQPAIRNYEGALNETPNRHGSEGYLKDPVVAKWIYDAVVRSR